MATPSKKTRVLADALYSACISRPETSIWRQEDLLVLEVVPDVQKLMPLIDLLQKESKLQARSIDNDSAVAFTVRAESAVSKYSTITDKNARNIYRLIENAGTAGMWKATLKRRLNLHENVVEKALRALQGTKHIKQLKSARSTAKKTYMLYELEPTKEVTGGGWYSDGELDYDLIEVASEIVVAFVRERSWLSGPRLLRSPSKTASVKHDKKRKRDVEDDGSSGIPSKKVDVKKSQEEVEDIPTSLLEQDGLEEEVIREIRANAATHDRHVLVPFPAGFKDYPTLSTIQDHVDASGIIEKDITPQDMRELLDRLVFDDQLERIPLKHLDNKDDEAQGKDDEDEDNTKSNPKDESIGYRWIRRPDSEWFHHSENKLSWNLGLALPKNGFSETPCSRCAVFNLCQEGGPVDARNCEYLKEWF